MTEIQIGFFSKDNSPKENSWTKSYSDTLLFLNTLKEIQENLATKTPIEENNCIYDFGERSNCFFDCSKKSNIKTIVGHQIIAIMLKIIKLRYLTIFIIL